MSQYRSECADCGEWASLNDDGRCDDCAAAQDLDWSDTAHRAAGHEVRNSEYDLTMAHCVTCAQAVPRDCPSCPNSAHPYEDCPEPVSA